MSACIGRLGEASLFWLVTTTALYLLMNGAYFGPTIIALQNGPPSAAVDPVVTRIATPWRRPNLARALIFLSVNIAMPSPLRQVHTMLVTAMSTDRPRR